MTVIETNTNDFLHHFHTGALDKIKPGEIDAFVAERMQSFLDEAERINPDDVWSLDDLRGFLSEERGYIIICMSHPDFEEDFDALSTNAEMKAIFGFLRSFGNFVSLDGIDGSPTIKAHLDSARSLMLIEFREQMARDKDLIPKIYAKAKYAFLDLFED